MGVHVLQVTVRPRYSTVYTYADVQEEEAPRLPPTIRLRGGPTLSVSAFPSATPYTLCTADSPADMMCDPGVAQASDAVEGDLLAVGLVAACRPSSYISSVGLAACTHVQLDTPGIYVITFFVSNSDVRFTRLPAPARHVLACCSSAVRWLGV